MFGGKLLGKLLIALSNSGLIFGREKVRSVELEDRENIGELCGCFVRGLQKLIEIMELTIFCRWY
jgi:hypothetical protein